MAKLAFACYAAVATAASPPLSHAEMFNTFVQDYSRTYTSEAERAHRFLVFSESMKFIEDSNAQGHSYTLGITQFADLTFEEVLGEYVGGSVAMPRPNATEFEKPADLVLDDRVDWREKNAVTPVQGQGHCGGCWAFSAIGALEGAMVVAGHPLTKLSEQELVTCDADGFTMMGCNGGNPVKAMSWTTNNGICSEKEDPFVCRYSNGPECQNHKCQKSKCTPVLKGGMMYSGDVYKVDYISSHAVEALEAAVMLSPISVQIMANNPPFIHYTKGVLTDDACGSKLDHAVLAVGYGVDGDLKYWLVKNSWNATWGEEGYVRIQRGKKGSWPFHPVPFGECGIRLSAAYAKVRAPKSSIVV